MATISPHTLQDLQASINTLVNNDNDTPTAGDDDWLTTNNLIYLAIKNWEGQDVFWNELWKTYTHGSTLSTATTYSLSSLTDMRFPSNQLRLTFNDQTEYLEFIKPVQAQYYREQNMRAVYLTGNISDGYTLNLTWTPDTSDGSYGASIIFDYYAYAFKPTNATDKVQMSDSNYIVYWVSAQKNLLDNKKSLYSVYDSQATECLDNMRIMNDVGVDYQSGKIENYDAMIYGSVIGE